MQEKLRELIARMRQEGETQETTGFPNSAKIARWCADELEAALAANPPEQQIEIQPTDICAKVHCGHPASEHNDEGNCTHSKCFCGQFEIARSSKA